MTVTEKFTRDAINKMFEICNVNKTYDVVLAEGNETWYLDQKWTEADREAWKTWFVKTAIQRKLCYNKSHATRQFEWFDLSYGPVVLKD